jgi:hypothetical protein
VHGYDSLAIGVSIARPQPDNRCASSPRTKLGGHQVAKKKAAKKKVAKKAAKKTVKKAAKKK